jgi:hypothetical protein
MREKLATARVCGARFPRFAAKNPGGTGIAKFKYETG